MVVVCLDKNSTKETHTHSPFASILACIYLESTSSFVFVVGFNKEEVLLSVFVYALWFTTCYTEQKACGHQVL